MLSRNSDNGVERFFLLSLSSRLIDPLLSVGLESIPFNQSSMRIKVLCVLGEGDEKSKEYAILSRPEPLQYFISYSLSGSLK